MFSYKFLHVVIKGINQFLVLKYNKNESILIICLISF